MRLLRGAALAVFALSSIRPPEPADPEVLKAKVALATNPQELVIVARKFSRYTPLNHLKQMAATLHVVAEAYPHLPILWRTVDVEGLLSVVVDGQARTIGVWGS